MNRICLKRKELQKKNSMMNSNENKEPEEHKQIEGPIQKPVDKPIDKPIDKPVQKLVLSQKSDQTPIPSSSSTVFEDFRKQYDQLRVKYDLQRKQFDELVRVKKRLQIQLMNNNTQYYEKELKRLKEEVQKYQEENEDHKYKYIRAENSRKQLEVTVRVKTEDMKKTIQQLEKQKILATEYKHQLGEKEKCFQRITEEMDKSNNFLSKNFEEITNKSHKLEAALKTKANQLESNIKANEFLNKKLVEMEKVMKNNKEVFDQTNFKKSQIIQELQNKFRSINRASRNTIEELEFKIQEIKSHRKTQNLLIDQRIQTVSSLKTQRINQLEIVRLQQINKQIKADYEDKCQLVKKFEERLLGSYTKQEYKQLENKIKQGQDKFKESNQSYEQRIFRLEKQLESLKLSKLPDTASQLFNNGTSEFKEVLKSQLEQNVKIRSELSKKVQEFFNMKSNLQDMKFKLRASEQEINIYIKKIKSLEKNHRIEADVYEQNMNNQVDSLKRKLEMLTAKFENKVKEVKQKQNFIISTIVGRSRQEDVPLILAQFQRIFETDYHSKILAANQRIGELQKKVSVDQK